MRTHRTSTTFFGVASLALVLDACGGGSGAAALHPPRHLEYSDEDALVASGSEIEPLLPTVEGDVVAFTVAPALPPGLVLDPVTGVIAGAPDAPAARRVHTVSARNQDGVARAQVAIEVAAPVRLALVTGALDGSVAALACDAASSGFVRSALSFATAGVVGAERVAVRPDGRFAYLTSVATRVVTTVALAPDGTAERIGTADIGAGPHALAIDPTGAFLLVACRGADTVQTFAIEPETGQLVPASETVTGVQPADLAFDASGTIVFVAHAGQDVTGLDSTLRAFALAPATGALAPLASPLQLNGGRPTSLCVDPRAPYVYATLGQFGDVLSVRVRPDGRLEPVPPLRPAGDGPTDIAVDARGRFAFVASGGDHQIHAFRIAPATHRLSGAGAFAAGLEPVALATDPLGRRLFAVARGSSELLTYLVDGEGTLARESTLATRAGATGLAFATGDAPLAFSPRWVHVLNGGSADVQSYVVEPATGALTSTGIAPCGSQPTAFALDPRRRFALVLDAGVRTLKPCAIDALTGALTAWGDGVALPGTPGGVAIEPAGRFAYVATRDVDTAGDGWILAFALDPQTGMLTPIEERPAGAGSIAVSVDPTGRFAYVANEGDGSPGSASISAFRLDAATGRPYSAGTAVAAPGISDITFHPDGRTVYAVLHGSDALARYSIDALSGVLVPVPPVAGGASAPSALSVEALGRFAYLAQTGVAGNGEIDLLTIAADGSFGPVVQQIVDGLDPVALAIDPSLSFLYAANQGSNDVSVFAIGAGGFLTPRAPALAGTAPVAIAATSRVQ